MADSNLIFKWLPEDALILIKKIAAERILKNRTRIRANSLSVVLSSGSTVFNHGCERKDGASKANDLN